MNKKAIYTRVLVFTVFFLATFFNANAQTELQKHIIKKGDTLYALSTSYGVTVNQILQYNPGLDSGGLKIGNSVLIPVATHDQIHEDESIKIKEVHKVKRKETLYSISRNYGITIDELKAANPEMFAPDYKLKKGKKINIPYHVDSKDKEKAIKKVYPTVKIALLLPFSSDAAGSNRCIEFYRGFLMAVEKMQADGQNVEIYAYNEPHAKSNIITILEKIRLNKVHLLVGPLYFDHFAAVSRFSNTNKIKTLIPFSSKVSEINENPYLYLLNAPEMEKNEFSSNLFMKNFSNYKAIFVASPSRNQRDFTTHLRSKLLSSGIEIGDVSVYQNDQQILAACNPKKQNVFIPDGATDNDFQKIMARMLQFEKKHPELNKAFFAYPEWQKFISTRRSDMHIVNTYLYTNAFYNPWSAKTNELKNRYKSWFRSDIIDTTPRMFMLGYDAGLTFISGLARYGRHFNTQDMKLPLEQSDIVFKKISDYGGYINGSMWFIHYRTDYQIEKVSER